MRFLAASFLWVAAAAVSFAAAPITPIAAQDGNSLAEIAAAPEQGFNFPYLLFLPKAATAKQHPYLLVEPNNTGETSDDLEVHRMAAIRVARDSSVGNYIAKKIGLPLLVPIFPRPRSLENTYTHSLDSDTISIAAGPLMRIDLQLLAMIADARKRLEEIGCPTKEKVLLNGFSASGLFANRFTFLHPEAVAAAAYGGLNSFIMAPVAKLNSHGLNFPLGLADYEKITGYPFDKKAFSAIPQFAYMGEKDENDAVLFDDAYSEEERSLIFLLFGRKMMPDRWQTVQKVYHDAGVGVRFKTYEGIGHGTNDMVNTEVAEFYRDVIEEKSDQVASRQLP